MGNIALNLPDELLKASTEYAAFLHLSRAAYIRQAVERMNREMETHLRNARLARASRKVREESLRVNAEFAAIEHDPDA